ncbi:hypothetical protein OSB04_014731 [Centaurea solstitialis]|uniref:Uncharacterized protein n=1 Tax=Centaurea solstitialis TaxID=347529 RepID=A0AA38WJF8_9ASTR|nr:hypothetical protein OSB04_014731 [Centaurea solstitialis]
MRKYSHLLTIGRSRALSILNNKRVHESSFIRSYLHHPQPPPPPSSILNHHHHYHRREFSSFNTLQLQNHEGDSPLDYQVTVKGRDVISAARAPPHEYRLPQSNLDLLLPPLDAGVFFCYEKKDEANMSPEAVVETIKKSLGGVLSTFYPLAGEIVPNGQGEPEVLCNNSGVEFTHAHADVELKTLDLHHPDETVSGKLVPKINRGVFAVQVTELKCGAIIVSCAFDHRIADGYSLNMFLVAWAEFAQFKQISNTPSFHSSILSPRRPPRYNPIFDNLYLPLSLLPPPPSTEDQLHSRIYYIQQETLNRLQSEASSKETRISKFQSLTAFIWKLFAHQADKDASRTSRMGVVVSGRRFMAGNSEKESSMLKTHFGNILSIPYGEMNNCCLQTMPLNEVANKVRSFVTEATTEEHFRGLVDWVELHRPEPAVAKIYFKLRETDGDAVVASSGQGLPIKDMNFGFGKPEFGSYHFPWGGQTGYIITMPSASKNGDLVVYVHLKQKHLDLIERSAPHVFNPLTHYYFGFN